MGYFTLELDTTGPEIAVYMPSTSTKFSYNEIIVEANEDLSSYQDFYFIDSERNRHDCIFLLDKNKYIGYVRFNEFAFGIATFHAQVRDEVGNLSNKVSSAINIIGAVAIADIKMSTRQRNINLKYRNKYIGIKHRNTKLNIKNKDTKFDIKIRTTTIAEELEVKT